MDEKIEIEKIYNEILEDLLKSAEGKEAMEKASKILTPALKSLARASFKLRNGTDEEKKIAKIIVENSLEAIQDIKDSLLAKLNNHLVDKVFEVLNQIIDKFLFSIVIK